MNIEDIKTVKLDEDYTYCYPYGPRGDAQLKCLRGKYEGLTLDITDSALIDINYESGENDKKFNYSYKILKMWNNVSNNQFDGRKIQLNENDQNYIGSIIYGFINEYLKNDKTNLIDNFKEIA